MSTEGKSRSYAGFDQWPTANVVAALFEGQRAAAAAVQPRLQSIARAAEEAAERLEHPAGRLVYVGAGTSGRLAVLDGTELEPTFGWTKDRLLFGIAGGMNALSASVEGAEDDEESARQFVRSAKLSERDVMIGIAASGTTPFTVAAVREASSGSALTIALSSNAGTPLLDAAKHPILLDTGDEVISGSTRMKTGTAQKIALNLLSTAIMVKLGRVFDDLMVDMLVSNQKLRGRAIRIIAKIGAVSMDGAETALELAQGNIKVGTLVAMGMSAEAAAELLAASHNSLRTAMRALHARGQDKI